MILKKRPLFLINKNSRGFTMVELMVVMAIISLLALTGMRTYFTTRAKVMDAAALSDARSLGTAVSNAFISGIDVNLAHDPEDGSKIGTQKASGGDRRPVFKLTNGMNAEITGNSNWGGAGYGFCSAEVWWPGRPEKKYLLEIDEKTGLVSTPST